MKNKQWTPWTEGRRIKAIVGHYGSGKTEIALNMGLFAKAEGHRACVVDIDIVNPFFRSAEQHGLLAEAGVELIHPPYALTGVDLPVLPAEVTRVFADKELYTVLDVGGDDAGAAALGTYKPYFEREPIDMLYVVNLFRPFSENAEQIMQLLERIARRARIAPTGLINNSNLGSWSEVDQVLEGQRVLEGVSREIGIPILCISGTEKVLTQLPPMPVPLFPIDRLTRPEWMEDD